MVPIPFDGLPWLTLPAGDLLTFDTEICSTVDYSGYMVDYPCRYLFFRASPDGRQSERIAAIDTCYDPNVNCHSGLGYAEFYRPFQSLSRISDEVLIGPVVLDTRALSWREDPWSGRQVLFSPDGGAVLEPASAFLEIALLTTDTPFAIRMTRDTEYQQGHDADNVTWSVEIVGPWR
jgi:hypothetical protein